jgi:hypothetical protein
MVKSAPFAVDLEVWQDARAVHTILMTIRIADGALGVCAKQGIGSMFQKRQTYEKFTRHMGG